MHRRTCGRVSNGAPDKRWISRPLEDSGMALHPQLTERLARLAPDQRAAATAPPGPVLCVAPAGRAKIAERLSFSL